MGNSSKSKISISHNCVQCHKEFTEDLTTKHRNYEKAEIIKRCPACQETFENEAMKTIMETLSLAE